MAKNNATCGICGKPYYLCMSCQEQMQLKPWKIHTDTSEHFKVYEILRAYNTGIYTKKEAQNALKNVDLSDKDTYLDYVQNTLNKLLVEEKPVVKKKANTTKKKVNNSEQ